MEESKEKWFRGIIPPMVTPLLDRDHLDDAGLAHLIEHLLAGGVHGLFLLGTTGEGPSLSLALRRHLIAATVQQVANRVPVLVCVSDSSLSESIELAEFAANAGAQAVVATPPHYFQISQDELLSHVKQLAGAVSLPLVLYNIPQLTNIWFEVDTIRRALELENIAGIKDSSGNMTYFSQLLDLVSQRDDCSLLMGVEENLAEAVQAGADGGVCGGANLFPRLYVDLYDAARQGEASAVRLLHADVMQINKSLYNIGPRSLNLIGSIKCALAQFGICQDLMAPPLQPFNDSEKQTLSERLQNLSVVGSSCVRSVFEQYAVPDMLEHTRHDIGNSHHMQLNPSLQRLSSTSNVSNEEGRD